MSVARRELFLPARAKRDRPKPRFSASQKAERVQRCTQAQEQEPGGWRCNSHVTHTDTSPQHPQPGIRAGTSGVVPHGGQESFSMTTAFGLGFSGSGCFRFCRCCLAFVLLFLAGITFFPTSTSPTSSIHLSTTTLIFVKLFTSLHSITAALQHIPYSFFFLIQISETAELFWACDRYYSVVPLFFTDFFFYHLFHFAANSTFVPWTNSITMTQPTAHSRLPCVSSCPLKPARSALCVRRAGFQLWAHSPQWGRWKLLCHTEPHTSAHAPPSTGPFFHLWSLKRHFL